MKPCVLIDFDGTLTIRDTTRYLIFELLKIRPWKTYALLPFFFSWVFQSGRAFQVTKNWTIGHMISGMTENQIKRPLQKFNDRVQTLLRQKLVDRIFKHVADRAIVIVVTASPEFAIKACTSTLPVQVIGTVFPMKNGIYDNKVEVEACFGDAKPRMIKDWLSRENQKVCYIEGWSDSISDYPMMSLASDRNWICDEREAITIKDLDPSGQIVIRR